MQETVSFWDKHAPGYVARPMKDTASYERAMERVRSYLAEDQDVLELGCGSGNTAMLLSGHVKHITASDISGKMLEFGRAKALDEGYENVEFLQCSVTDPALIGKSYNVVMVFNLIHLLKEEGRALERIHQLLKPDGLFISKTPCLGDSGFYLRWLISLLRLVGYAPYVNNFKQVELGHKIEKAGFKIVETGNYPASPMGRFIVARKV